MAGVVRAFSRLVALISLVAVLMPSAAAAHEGDPNIDTVIVGLRPSGLSGVQVEVVQGVVPALSVLNTSGRELEVLDARGTPFLRIGPRGAEGNAAAAAFYRSAAPADVASVPAGVGRAGAPARWVLLSRRPAWAWYDDRVPDIAVAPPQVRGRAAPTLLASFTVPLVFDGQAAAARGEVTYVPPRLHPAPRLTSSMHPAPGVTVALLAATYPDLYVQNNGTRTVTILGAEGEPFAQIGPHGVRVNVRSPIYAADAAARGNAVKATANPGAPPLWRQVSATPAYDWLDPRPRLDARWSVPMLIGMTHTAITGTLSGTPAATGTRNAGRDEGISGVLIAALVLAALTLFVSLALARRRRPAKT